MLGNVLSKQTQTVGLRHHAGLEHSKMIVANQSKDWRLTETIIFDDGFDHSVETKGTHPSSASQKQKKGKKTKKAAAATATARAADPPRIVLAVGITHPQIVADWRTAYTIPRMDGNYMNNQPSQIAITLKPSELQGFDGCRMVNLLRQAWSAIEPVPVVRSGGR